jgi:desulfoferrodoxin-like iron-binding protein
MAFVKEVGEVWRCEICGNVVEVKHVGGGLLICCGGPMTKVEPDE